MSELAYRGNTVLPSVNSAPGFGASYTVTAYEVGAVASANSSGATITVNSGHGFAEGDKILVNPGTDDTFSGTDTVQSTTSTTVVMGQSYSISSGDQIVNLGPDTGVASPNYDGSGYTVYSDMDGGTSISNSQVTCNAQGSYEYWHYGFAIWELVRDSDGDPVALIIPEGSYPSATSIRNREDRGGRVFDMARSPFDVVGLGMITSATYYLFMEISSGMYWRVDLNQKTVNGTTCHSAELAYICKAFASVHQLDASATHTGTWSAGSNASAYETYYKHSVTTDDDVTYVSPGAVIALAIRTVRAANGGLAKVEINGSATAASLCKTAQDVVDDGDFPGTILVGGGGNLNPTDRVINFYASATEYDHFYPVANNLTAGVQTLKISNTGYKQSGATDDRVYSGGYMYHTSDTSIGVDKYYDMVTLDGAVLVLDGDVVEIEREISGNVLMEVEPVFSVPYASSSYEYAHYFYPTGGSATWIGNNAHGYDDQASISFKVDGVTVTPTAPSITVGSVVEVTRVSDLFHPDYDGGSTKVADVTTVYRISRDGLEVFHETVWAITGTLSINYTAMFPLDREVFDRCSLSAASEDYTLSGSDAQNGTGLPGSDTCWAWEDSGNKLAVVRIPNPELSVNNWKLPISLKTHIQDRSTASTHLMKCYFRRSDSTNTESVSDGTIHRGHAIYRMAYLPDSGLMVAR